MTLFYRRQEEVITRRKYLNYFVTDSFLFHLRKVAYPNIGIISPTHLPSAVRALNYFFLLLIFAFDAAKISKLSERFKSSHNILSLIFIFLNEWWPHGGLNPESPPWKGGVLSLFHYAAILSDYSCLHWPSLTVYIDIYFTSLFYDFKSKTIDNIYFFFSFLNFL